MVDLTVEEAPLEDVISELFTRRSGRPPPDDDGRREHDGDRRGVADRRDADDRPAALEPATVETRSEDRA